MIARLNERQAADLVQVERVVAGADAHVARFFAQSCALATRADLVADQFGEVFAYGDRIGLFVAAFQIADDAFEGVVAVKAGAFFVEIAKADDLLARTVKDDLLNVLRERFERGVDVEAVMLGQRGEQLEVEGIAPIPAANRPRRQ